jgi:hypothetical protein
MKGIVMHSQLGVLSGRSVDLWQQHAPATRTEVAPALRPRADVPLVTPQDLTAANSLIKSRPDLALALERLAGIDPEQRQEQYEAIRRELLKLSPDGTLQLELGPEGGGGATYFGSPEAGEAEAESPDTPALPPPSRAMLLQAYQQASRPEVPTSILANRTV